MFIFAAMKNAFFHFQQFTVWQDRTAMKVGTDGTLLGAWAEGGLRILDVGTGTGLVALMMAQRFPLAAVTAVEIVSEAAAQAADNVARSPFATRIKVVETDVRLLAGQFDCMVCNPPFFSRSLQPQATARAVARHDDSLSLSELAAAASRLLTPEGTLSVVVPALRRGQMEAAAAWEGFLPTRRVAVSTTPTKQPSRYLLSFSRIRRLVEETNEVLETSPSVRSPWYEQLTQAFYLSMD